MAGDSYCTVCGTRLDPVIVAEGHETHPGCDPRSRIRRPRGRPDGLARPTDNAAQRAGARFAAPRAGTQRYKVLAALVKADRTMIYDEICAATGMTYSSAGPRTRELAEDGYVTKTGHHRRGHAGAQQEEWLATDKGRRAVT